MAERCWLALLTLAFVAAAPAAVAEPPPLIVACSAERPVAERDKEVTVRAWVEAPAPGELRFGWASSAGRLSGRSEAGRSTAVWDLAGAALGPQAATVSVSHPDGRFATCTVEVVFVEISRGDLSRVLETGRSLLRQDEAELRGYGLYSYLLLGSPPEPEARARVLAAIGAYLEVIPPVLELERHFQRSELNVTYLPLELAAGAEPPERPEELLERYDYARARSWLRHLGGGHRGGPYLVSSQHPLSAPPRADQRYLVQDLSGVPPELAALWVREFLHQAAQERYWQPRILAQLRLRLRTTLALAALGLPDVREALDGWLQWRPGG